MTTILPSPPRVGMVSLGCPKNLVDSERILTTLRADGYQMSPDYAGADVVLVNTCGFLDSAKEESLSAIGEAIAENGRVIVTGCMGDEAELIRARFPDVLAVTGAHQYEDVVEAVHEAAPPSQGPFVDLIPQRQADLAQAIPEILQSNPSVIVMADIGRLPQETYEPMQKWLAGGGTLIRFAGPRLAAAPADDPLVPVTLRQGERALGGALSWAEPQPLADFPAFGAFAGMPKADGILVKRQVLAEPTPDLAERTWASLADGTPLVTTRNVEAGRIVLFHVSAEASWSDLPISGHFVDMLRRIVQLSKAGGASASSGSAHSSCSRIK